MRLRAEKGVERAGTKDENDILTFFTAKNLVRNVKSRNFASGESWTTSSPRIPQVLTEARVSGCSGAMQTARPFASLAQLARARDL